MDHDSAQRDDLFKRGLHIGDREIRQRSRVARASATFVNAERRSPALGLPTTTFSLAALSEVDAEEPRPESTGAGGIIGRKLD